MTTSAEMKEKYFRRQALYWLALAGVMLVAWLVLWLISNTPKIIRQTTSEQIIKTTAIDLPIHIDVLGELNKEVPPIDFSTLAKDLRFYPKEFKDRHYFNTKKYTIELMDVSQNEIIVNYLNGRLSDRNKFAYFRYLDDHQNPRYVLTYGMFDSMEAARTANQAMNFSLPSSVKPSVVLMSDYLEHIDHYERSEAIRDLDLSSQSRQVKLQVTHNEIAAQVEVDTEEGSVNTNFEQVQEKIQQMTSSEQELKPKTVAALPSSNEHQSDKPKAKVAQSESKSSKTPTSNELKEVPTPMVNTPKVPGSE